MMMLKLLCISSLDRRRVKRERGGRQTVKEGEERETERRERGDR